MVIITRQEMSRIMVGCRLCKVSVEIYLSRYEKFKSARSDRYISAYAIQLGDP
jgi:hypothetical protein